MEVLSPLPRPLWVRVKGVPLHIWHEKVFLLIGEYLGRAMKVDCRTVEEVDLHCGRIEVVMNKMVSLPLHFPVWVEGIQFLLQDKEDGEVEGSTVNGKVMQKGGHSV